MTAKKKQDPLDELPEDDEQQPDEDEVKNVPTENKPTGDEVSSTMKAGSGYDAPWVVARSGTPKGLLGLLEDYNMKQVLTKTAEISSWFGRQFTPTKTGQPSKTEAPNGDTRTCAHGEMTFRSGVSRNGKAYKAFFCTAPREDQCSPVWM